MEINLIQEQRLYIAKLLLLIGCCLLLTVFSGCGENVSDSNTELSDVHAGGPDCTQSGCHSGFGAAGTVFTDSSGSSPAEGVTVTARSVETGSETTLGVSDSLGNFYYDQELSGYYNMMVGNNAWSQPHYMPERKGCNSCHAWPPNEDAEGRLSE